MKILTNFVKSTVICGRMQDKQHLTGNFLQQEKIITMLSEYFTKMLKFLKIFKPVLRKSLCKIENFLNFLTKYF